MSNINIKNFFNHFNTLINEVNSYKLILGIVSDNSNRKVIKQGQKKELNNAEILAVHEFGSKVKNIPKRPILQTTIDNADELINTFYTQIINKILDGSISNRSQIKKQLNLLSLEIENLLKDLIYTGAAGLTPLAPYTVEKKGSDLPLFDTGQLVRSIVCVPVKK